MVSSGEVVLSNSADVRFMDVKLFGLPRHDFSIPLCFFSSGIEFSTWEMT